jgi:hypothetical protein
MREFLTRIDKAIARAEELRDTENFGSLAPAGRPDGEAATMPPNWMERQKFEDILRELFALKTSLEPAHRPSPVTSPEQRQQLHEIEFKLGLIDPKDYRP